MKKFKRNLPTIESSMGGGILNRKNPKELQRFTKNKKEKTFLIAGIIGIVLIMGGISLYRTFALYKEEQTFNVLEGTIPDFSSGDIQLAITIDGEKKEEIPTSDNNYGVVVACDHAKGSWDKDNWRAILEQFTGSKVKCNLYFESTLSGYIKALSKVDESIIEEKHDKTEQTPELTDYRYVGATPNNYVCLEEEGSCNENNLYRIIGVIPTQKEENQDSAYEDRVKLIKNTHYIYNTWIGSSSDTDNNDWTKSTLNTDILNQVYWTEIESYHNYIDIAKWYLGGFEMRLANNILYSMERGNIGSNSNLKTINTISKIGLIYPSDYVYATSGSIVMDRNSCLLLSSDENGLGVQENECVENNWLHLNANYFTINPSSITKDVFIISQNNGIVSYGNASKPSWIYPTFYLKSIVQYKDGDGTYENPYRISIN